MCILLELVVCVNTDGSSMPTFLGTTVNLDVFTILYHIIGLFSFKEFN